MKKNVIHLILLIFSFAVTLGANAQDVTGDVNKLINNQINNFATTLDSIVIKPSVQTVGTTVAIIDTLAIPLNTTCTFDIQLKAENTNTKETTRAHKELDIRNNNGVYSLAGQSDLVVYPGGVVTTNSIRTASWSVVLVNGIYVIQAKGVAGTIIKWTIVKHQIITAL